MDLIKKFEIKQQLLVVLVSPILKVLITKGAISRKHGKYGEDIGFNILFPDEYAGSLETVAHVNPTN